MDNKFAQIRDSAFIAAYKNDHTHLEQLLNEGLDINIKNEEGETLLISAARFGSLDAVQLLCERGADINYGALIKDEGDDDFLNGEELIDNNGCDLPEYKLTPLVAAALAGYDKVVNYLLICGAEVADDNALPRIEYDWINNNIRRARYLRENNLPVTLDALDGSPLITIQTPIIPANPQDTCELI